MFVDKISLHPEISLACSRLSVSKDDRKRERVTSGISCERDPREKRRDLSFFPTRPHSSPTRFFNPPLTESLEQAKISCVQRENKGLGTVFSLILSEKIDYPWKQYTSFSLVRLKCCCLPWEYLENVTVFRLEDWRKSRHFSKLEPGAQSKLAHAYYVFPLWSISQ